MRMIALSTGWAYVAVALAGVLPKRFFYTCSPFIAGITAALWTVYAIDHHSGEHAFYGAVWAGITVVATWTWDTNGRVRRYQSRIDEWARAWV